MGPSRANEMLVSVFMQCIPISILMMDVIAFGTHFYCQGNGSLRIHQPDHTQGELP